MSLFRRKRETGVPSDAENESIEEMEENPELLAAEKLVNELPPPPPSTVPLTDAWIGPPPEIVAFPEKEEPPPAP